MRFLKTFEDQMSDILREYYKILRNTHLLKLYFLVNLC